MKTLYIVTGANGHLGSTLCTLLRSRGDSVRGLVLPMENTDYLDSLGVDVVWGDIRSPLDLEMLFTHESDTELIVVHTAAIVDIDTEYSAAMEEVNVCGTKNMLAIAKAQNVKRFIYVSSVHAIPEQPKNRVIYEVDAFSPIDVYGAYAKTKAAAAALVLQATREGLPAVILHPSGIIGPYPGKNNHLVQLIKNYIDGKLAMCVPGGYDFVDVRDCADAILSACERGRTGECYILSNRFCEIRNLLRMLRQIAGGKRIGVVSSRVAHLFAPLLSRVAKRQNKKPLYTKYSLFTLSANGNFCHDKATIELGFTPREIYVTLQDTVKYLFETGECKRHRFILPHRRRAAKHAVSEC